MSPFVLSILRSFFSLPNCLLIFFKVALNFFFSFSTMSWTQDTISWRAACKNTKHIAPVRWWARITQQVETSEHTVTKKKWSSKMPGLMRPDSGFSFLHYLTSHLLRTSSSTTSFSWSDEIFFSCSAASKNLSRTWLSRALKASWEKKEKTS